MIQKKQLQFEQKAEKIICQIHKKPITQLNITQNEKLGERLICSSCGSFGKSLISLNQTEEVLYEWYKEDQETICQEQQKVDENIKLTQSRISEIQKNFENYLHLMYTRINELQEKIASKFKSFSQSILNNSKEWNKLIEQNSNIKLQEFITKITISDVIDEQTLQLIAEYISNQSIKDGKLILKDQIRISDQRKKSIQQTNDKLIDQLNSIKVLLENSEKQEQDLQNKNTQIQKVQKQQQDKPLDYDTFKYNDPIQLKEHNKYIGAVAMSNNELLMASGDWIGQIILWDFNSRSIKQKYNGEQRIQDLIFSFDDKLLAAAQFSSPCDILIFNLSLISSTSPQIRLKGHSSNVWRIVFTSNSQFLISGSCDDTFRIWKLDGSREVCNKKLQSDVYGVNMSPNQKYISACCYNGQAYLFNSSDIQNTKELINWKANEYACGTTFTPDSKMVLISGQGDIKLWNIDQLLSNDQAKKTPLKVFKTEQNSYFWSLSIRMNGSILISNDGQIRIWNMESGKLIQTLSVPGGYKYLQDQNFSVSKDMKYIITGGSNSKLKVYELKQK